MLTPVPSPDAAARTASRQVMQRRGHEGWHCSPGHAGSRAFGRDERQGAHTHANLRACAETFIVEGCWEGASCRLRSVQGQGFAC